MSYKPTTCKDTKEYAKTYEDYLATRHWRTLRVEVAKLKNYHCELCDKKIEVGYHIHHKTYKHLGNENFDDLMFLCENCHKELHIALRAKKNNLKKPKRERKTCQNCFYSQIMVYKGKENRRVLWCNMKCFEAKDNVCSYYKRGVEKSVGKPKNKKKSKNKKNKGKGGIHSNG